MYQRFLTDNGLVRTIDEHKPGCWIALINPDGDDCQEIAREYNIDIADLRAALDEEESSRVEIEDNYTMILFDIPTIEIRNKQEVYTTKPLGIIWRDDVIITVCSEEVPFLQPFKKGKIKGFSTKKQVRFIYQIMLKVCMQYQSYLRVIDKKRTEMEERVSKNMKDADIVSLHELESTLVYFDTSLRGNRLVLEKISRYSKIPKYEEDRDLIDDIVVENQQAIEMTQIYRDIIRGTRELMSSVLDNRLNNVMKYLASVTIVMSIPTIISGLYGMNVAAEWMPLANTPHGFGIICAITGVICLITGIILKKRKMM